MIFWWSAMGSYCLKQWLAGSNRFAGNPRYTAVSQRPLSGEIKVLLDRLSTLNVYMARSGEMLAEAVFLQEEAINRAFEENKDRIDCMAATVANKYLTSCCRHENRLVKWLDRINATCKHQSDNLRTQISFVKEQVRLDGRGY